MSLICPYYKQKENLQVYSLSLTDQEMAKLDSLRDHPSYMYAGEKPEDI